MACLGFSTSTMNLHVCSGKLHPKFNLAPAFRNKPTVNSMTKQHFIPDGRISAPIKASPVSLPVHTVDEQQVQTRWLDVAKVAVLRVAGLAAVIMAVVLSSCDAANAASSGGRAGGNNFSAKRVERSYSRTASRSVATHSTHTTVIHQTTPSWGFGFMPSFFVPVTPFGFGHSYHSGGSLLVSILFLAVMAMLAIQVFKMFSSKNEVDEEDLEDEVPPVSVMKLQIGLLGVAKELRSDLDRLAVRADTSGPEGLHFLLQETVLALLRNPDYCVYAASSSKVVQDETQAESVYAQLSMQERSKFKQETLTNISGNSKRSIASSSASGVNEMIVVTMLVAAEGVYDFPAVKTGNDLKVALSKLGSVPPSAVMGVELLWTPQAEGDALTREEVMLDYPQMVPL